MLAGSIHYLRRFALLWVIALGGIMDVSAAEPAYSTNPLARLARVFNPKLVDIEDRVGWLEVRLATMARHHELPLKTAMGYRGGRYAREDADPSVTINLGRGMPIEQLYLVPAQREFIDDIGLFPLRFSIEVSGQSNFSDSTVLFTTADKDFASPGGRPVLFSGNNIEAQFVRLTVHRGHRRTTDDTFALSELVVISEGQPVSFGAEVTTVGSLDSTGAWLPAALVDGRMPHGLWVNGRSSPSRGDSIVVLNEDDSVSWQLDLDSPKDLDHLVIFPYQLGSSAETAILPDLLEIHVFDATGQELRMPLMWFNPFPGSNITSPIVMVIRQAQVSRLVVTGIKPWKVGDFRVHGLSEIEAWSGGTNVAAGRTVTRKFRDDLTEVLGLTDGHSSEQRIIDVGVWLRQLHDRGEFERELNELRPKRMQMASESELNATWGSAILLSLTFLIPVYIVERRRVKAKKQVDLLRKRIACDLHDDIGSNLGSISLIARTAKKDLVRLQGPKEIGEDLGEVESIARESSLAMRDIVWLLERERDTIGDLIARMRESASRLLREIPYDLDSQSERTAAKLSLDAKRHLFLFYKEAIHNIVKHSEATHVMIRLWDEGEDLALEISDDGVGLPSGQSGEAPETMRKLRDRARVLGGRLTISAAEPSGTRISFRVRRSTLNQNPPSSS